jgi:hypothetical protein
MIGIDHKMAISVKPDTMAGHDLLSDLAEVRHARVDRDAGAKEENGVDAPRP